MIDLHSHMLPQIDDGAKSLSVALDMARITEGEGITKVFVTPHFIEDTGSKIKEEVISASVKFNKELEKENIKVKVIPGQEVYLTPSIGSLYKEGKIMTLGDSNYMLLELPMNNLPIYVEDILYELRLLGIKPIIAHPERYSYIIDNPNILREWILQGNYTQMNCNSLSGLFGKNVKDTAEILLKNNMIHFIGTDCHSIQKRSPHFKIHLSEISEIAGEEYKDELLKNNELIVNNLDVPIRKPKIYKKKMMIFSFLERVNIKNKKNRAKKKEKNKKVKLGGYYYEI